MFKFTPNIYAIDGDVAIFETYSGMQFKIDAEDVDKIAPYHWNVNKKGYVVADVHGKNKMRFALRLHRVITNCPENMVVDHINHNTLDNRKCNLRVCTQDQNIKNRKPDRNSKSGIKGVYPENGRWRAMIGINGKIRHLGTYIDINDAIKARHDAERKLYGEYSCIQEV